jgi:hypothetical protein
MHLRGDPYSLQGSRARNIEDVQGDLLRSHSKHIQALEQRALMKWSRRLLKTSFLKFAAVGGAGTMTNLAVFLLLADKIHWNPLAASVISFCLAVSQNYLLNASWTFL